MRRSNDPTANYGAARNGQRGADYGSRTAPRQDPGTRGFGVPTDVRRNGSVRSNNVRGADYGNSSSTRQIPSRGFGVPTDTQQRSTGNAGSVPRRGADYGTTREVERVGDVRRSGSTRSYGGSTTPAPTRSYSNPRSNVDSSRAEADRRGYDLPSSTPRRYTRPATGSNESMSRQAPPRDVRTYDDSNRGYSVPTPQPRRYEAPVQQQAPRGYGQSAPRSYSAPAPSYSAPAPQRETYSAPARESYSAPSRESYSPPARESSRDSGSRGDSGGVRRVGRDDR